MLGMTRRGAWTSLVAAPLAALACAGEPSPGGVRAAAPARTHGERDRAGGAACPRDCDGAAPAELEAALRARAQDARSCYESALERDPALAGRLLVTLTLSESGEACDVEITSTTVALPDALKRCLERVFDARFVPIQGGCVRAVLPLKLQSEQESTDP